MLDLDDFNEERGGDPHKIKESQRRRGASEELVDEVIALWQESRAVSSQPIERRDQFRAETDRTEKEGQEDAEDLLLQKDQLERRKTTEEEIAAVKLAALQQKARLVGNYVHNTVPVSIDEEHNETLRKWAPEGFEPDQKPALSHHEVLWRLDGYDPVRGVKLVGHRGYCLTGYGVFLNMALINYGVEFLFQHGQSTVELTPPPSPRQPNKCLGYTPNQPPFFLNRCHGG